MLGEISIREMKCERLTQVIRSVAQGLRGGRLDQLMKSAIEAESASDRAPRWWRTSSKRVWLSCHSRPLSVITEFCSPLPHYVPLCCLRFIPSSPPPPPPPPPPRPLRFPRPFDVKQQRQNHTIDPIMAGFPDKCSNTAAGWGGGGGWNWC